MKILPNQSKIKFGQNKSKKLIQLASECGWLETYRYIVISSAIFSFIYLK